MARLNKYKKLKFYDIFIIFVILKKTIKKIFAQKI